MYINKVSFLIRLTFQWQHTLNSYFRGVKLWQPLIYSYWIPIISIISIFQRHEAYIGLKKVEHSVRQPQACTRHPQHFAHRFVTRTGGGNGGRPGEIFKWEHTWVAVRSTPVMVIAMNVNADANRGTTWGRTEDRLCTIRDRDRKFFSLILMSVQKDNYHIKINKYMYYNTYYNI